MKTLLTLVFALMLNGAVAQSSNPNLNAQLEQMKTYFLAEDFDNFANYTYPKILELMGGKTNLVQASQQSMQQMKSEGFEVLDLQFKDASGFLEKAGEKQCTVTQQITMKTPQGTVQSEYSLIGISSDNGANWTFMDTSGKSKATMLQYFPNLHPDLEIKPKTQQFLD